MTIIVNGGSPVVDYYPGVKFNGADMQQVILNGTTVWNRYPYPPGTDVFTYTWGAGSNIAGFISAYYAAYPKAFASAPYFSQGGGSPDSRIQFTLFSGFLVSSYHQDQYGTQSIPSGTTGGSYTLYVGNTVTGLSGTNLTLPGAGNGNSNLTVRYVGN